MASDSNAEFQERIEHTGGVLSIHKTESGVSLRYTHANAHRVVLTELVAVGGEPVGFADIAPYRDPVPQVRVEFPSDREGMFGRLCPACASYFRSSVPFTTICPYCGTQADPVKFLTPDQREFVRRQHDAILAAANGPIGTTVLDFNGDTTAPTRANATYSEERQQTRFTCSGCKLDVDVLGEYVLCPRCGKARAREVFYQRLSDIETDFDRDVAGIPEADRPARQRRWRQHIGDVVAEFDALGRDAIAALSRLPAIPSRRQAVARLTFQSVRSTGEKLLSRFGLDLWANVESLDREFVIKMINRRHLLIHRAGVVDQEYLRNTGDTTVRLNQTIAVSSNEVRRLINALRTVAANLLNGMDAIS